MLLGIKPTVDFVFKKVFGSPENIPVLIGARHGGFRFHRSTHGGVDKV